MWHKLYFVLQSKNLTMSNTPILYRVGLGLIGLLFPLYLSLLWKWLPEAIVQDPLTPVMVFFITSAVYFIATLVQHIRRNRWRRFHKLDEKSYSVALVLFSLSAHALNLTEVRVFEPYVPWLLGYVWLIHGAILLFPYREKFPSWGRYALFFVNGAGLVLCIYLSIFLGPLLVIAIPAALFLGLSLHATVPVWIGVRLAFSYRQMGDLPYARRAFWAGVVLPIAVLGIFMQQWISTQNKIAAPNTVASADLPEWVATAQQLPDHYFTEQILLNEGINQQSLWGADWGLGVLDFGGRREFRRHDPLGIIARAIHGDLPIEKNDLRYILEARYDARHMTHRRLWRGKDLITSEVNSTIDLYPQFRLAYQEMTLRIRNTTRKRWGRQQEAVYSFHLPPGAVATSLSLWVDGEERPSVLTTRAKADRAYETIVGRERRDPALLHWQEGNRVTITVFPCTPEEERQLKIGFTLPLKYRDGKLCLPQVAFDGPATWRAKQQTDVYLQEMAGVEGLALPISWRKKSNAHWQYEGRYQTGGEVWMDAPPISKTVFTWEGQSYQMAEVQEEKEHWQPRRIYLDVNVAWSPWAIERIWSLVENYEVYVFAPKPVRLTEANRDQYLSKLHVQRFSMPPLYQITEPGEALVISASGGNTPLLSDLDGSPYARQMGEWLQTLDQPLRWINLSEDVAPYVQTLYDLRVIDLQRCDREELEVRLEEGDFSRLEEGETLVYLPSADVMVQRSKDSVADGKAPDHLFRLFAYQQLLTDIGREFYDRSALEETWIRKAEEAFVVSPVSSLLVLETDADYERFDIDPNQSTLGNAIAKGDGAAPEPHEWVLIALAALLLLWLAKRQNWWGA